MRAGARLAAAMEILDLWLLEGGAAEPLIAAWGRAHRFAGKSDRAAIADHVFSALRHRARAAWIMGAGTGRALILGTLALEKLPLSDIEALLEGPHAPPSLTPAEAARLAQPSLDEAPPWVAGDYPQWLLGDLAETFGGTLLTEMTALADRAPLDLRVNLLKATRPGAHAALAAEGVEATACPHSPLGLRLPAGMAVQRMQAFADGLVEVQDEGSQLVSLMAGAAPGMTVVDLAAGAGGKALALAAAMRNEGRIIACDTDRERLAALAPRARRAGAEIIETQGLADPPRLPHGADLVLVDAPCSGSGTWRRAPDMKWGLTPRHLDRFCRTQAELLSKAAGLVKPGGRLAYVTCSFLPRENEAQIADFLDGHKDFGLASPGPEMAAIPCHRKGLGLLLSPARTGTDGFFFAVLERASRS